MIYWWTWSSHQDKLLSKSSRWATAQAVGLLLYFLLPTWGMFYHGRSMDMSVAAEIQPQEMLQQGCQPLWCKQRAWRGGSMPDASLVYTFTRSTNAINCYSPRPTGPNPQDLMFIEGCWELLLLLQGYSQSSLEYCGNWLWGESGHSIQAHKRWGDWEQSGKIGWGQILPDQPDCLLWCYAWLCGWGGSSGCCILWL